MARGVMAALQDPDRSATVDLVSEFRSYDGRGDRALQDRLFAEADAEISRLTDVGGWDAWVTYHCYYKAPDLLGPQVAAALNIPYLQIEATRAAKRFGGPWDRFARVADASCDMANAIFYLTELDFEGLHPYQTSGQPLKHLRPFLNRETLPNASEGHTILSVGMMRRGDKFASYEIIAETLSHLQGDWVYEIAGDGPARPEVETLFAPFGDKVRFLGELGADGLREAYARARVFFWPGVNEAFGMVYLEAQAAGVPVVAQNRHGVRDVVPINALVAPQNLPGLAKKIQSLLQSKAMWQTQSARARKLIAERHLLGAARERLWSVIEPQLEGQN